MRRRRGGFRRKEAPGDGDRKAIARGPRTSSPRCLAFPPRSTGRYDCFTSTSACRWLIELSRFRLSRSPTFVGWRWHFDLAERHWPMNPARLLGAPGRAACLPAARRKPCAARGHRPSRSIGDLGDQLRLDPMTRESTSGDPNRVVRGTPRGDVVEQRIQGGTSDRQNFHGRPVPTAGIDEFAVIAVEAEQQGPKVRPRISGSLQPTMTNSWWFSDLALRQRPRFPGA